MKSSVEQLSPTRVRINVEVPFTELEPDFQRAYKELAKQVRMPGFRPGKVPMKLLEARFGRGRCSTRSSARRCPPDMDKRSARPKYTRSAGPKSR